MGCRKCRCICFISDIFTSTKKKLVNLKCQLVKRTIFQGFRLPHFLISNTIIQPNEVSNIDIERSRNTVLVTSTQVAIKGTAQYSACSQLVVRT